MGPRSQDPTEGETARAIRGDPDAPQRILDPTDPRCGRLSPVGGGEGRNARWISDPTDPEFGEAA